MAHDLVTELLQYSSLACFMPIWQLCVNLLIPNCLRSNLSYSPLAALELYVKKSTSFVYTPKNLFQFHKGTIKTNVGADIAQGITRFQFHKGTIKTFSG